MATKYASPSKDLETKLRGPKKTKKSRNPGF